MDGSVTDFARALAGAVWCDVVPRSAACPALSARVLLHAGPPFRGAAPAPVLNAAVQALLFEGLARDESDARRRLATGEVTLQPAQDHGVVTPLAQIVSASMPLAVVMHHSQTFHGALLEGGVPALRFGAAAAQCRDRLRALAAMGPALAASLRRMPVALDEVVRRAVAGGDECHSRTGAANEAMLAQLGGVDAGVAGALRAIPAFVLPVLMAGAAAAVRHHGGAVEALGGNGADFGVRRRGELRWRQVRATPPRGERLPGCANVAALPAIGDSVLVDFCGLGAQVDEPARRALLDPRSGIVDPARVAAATAACDPSGAAHSMTPAFNLAILDATGAAGLIGRGVYLPPAELFSIQ